MKNYIRIFKFVTYYILSVSLFFGFFALTKQKFIGLLFFTFIFIIWYKSYTYLKKQTQKAFVISFFVVNIFWLPLLYRTIQRILFVYENGGMERTDGYGSPMAFLLGLFFEQIFFIPLTVLFIYGLFFILSKRDK